MESAETKRILKKVQVANKQLEENHNSKIHQIQAQVLKEVEQKLTVTPDLNGANANSAVPQGEWARKAHRNTRTQWCKRELVCPPRRMGT